MMQSDFKPFLLCKDYEEETAEFEKRFFKSAWSSDSKTEFFICTDCGSVICAAGALRTGSSAEILCVATDEKYRGRGAGKAVLEALMKYLSESGVREFNLEVRASNPAAGLYESLGFRRVGHRKNYYTEPVEDAVLMTKGMNKF